MCIITMQTVQTNLRFKRAAVAEKEA